MSHEEQMKAAVKEALKEWLDERWMQYTSTIGKWMLGMLSAAALAAVLYLILWSNGWKQP
jgi:ABC-type multidrug transport system permease subunit